MSLDQFAAEHVDAATRYSSIPLSMTSEGQRTLSYTRSGAPIPAENSPRKLFQKLFVQGKASEVEANVEALRQGQSMLDFVGGQSKRLNRMLSKADQRRMDEYYTSVRELEKRLHSAEQWEYKPKPVVKAEPPNDIEDAKSQRFIEDFLSQWLKLRAIAANDPDKKLYPEFSPYLQDSMVAETLAYFRELIEHNLDAGFLVQSDFAMLNEKLAAHYGIAGVSGPAIRKVKLPPGCARGGFLTQAAILKVTANGTTTSPVVRGAFVMDRLLGRPPEPPPANVPAVEPDVQGATTIRELLDKHRSDATCASCHVKMDPPGFALESFDVIGGQRDRYRSIGEGEPAPRGSIDPKIGIIGLSANRPVSKTSASK